MFTKLITIRIIQKPNVIRHAEKPNFDQMLDLFKIMASKPTVNAAGGPNTVRSPPRIPKGEPHPKPGQPSS